MCGRFNLRTDAAEFAAAFGVPPPIDAPLLRFNIAPTQPILIVRLREPLSTDRRSEPNRRAAGGPGRRSERGRPSDHDDQQPPDETARRLGQLRSDEDVRSDKDGGELGGDNAAPASREAVAVRWGLVPSWADDPKIGSRMINARSETAADKPSFRAAYKRRRCLIPASGFYEWRPTASPKQPFHIAPHAGGLLAFAGLWERWMSPAGETLESATILTTDANALIGAIHDRMPVILTPSEYDLWLAAETPRERLQSLLRPAAEDLLDLQPISTHVNNVRCTGPECLAPAGT